MSIDQRLSELSLHVNGAEVRFEAPGDERLIETLRQRVGVRSVRESCGIGVCGTCTVLVDGKPVSSCLMFTGQAVGRMVTTSEGLVDEDGSLDPVQEAFVDKGAYQCSFCIPAMVLTVRAFLDGRDGARGSLDDLREYLGGNLCRCGSYPEILDAAAALLNEGARR
ncbi:MAG: (2Fe-2S)-binding protein [Acidimicrobiia bacterium]